MAKFTLDTGDDDDVDFLLIGIVSHAKPYRLCWNLNKSMHLNLVNTGEFIEINIPRKKQTQKFEIYNYNDEESRINYYLIPNKSSSGYLLPEFKHIDYVLMLKENIFINIDGIIEKLRSGDQVLTAIEIKTDDVKSIENLLF